MFTGENTHTLTKLGRVLVRRTRLLFVWFTRGFFLGEFKLEHGGKSHTVPVYRG